MQDKKNQLSLDELLKVDLERDPSFVLPKDEMEVDPVQTFKNIMSFLESSGGKNIKHKTMTEGIHAGTTAQGRTGLMPNTARELANRRKLAGNVDEIDQKILTASDSDIESMLKTKPELYDRYENDLARLILDRAGGDMELAAGKWRWGQNRPIEETKDILERNPIYRQRFQEAKRLVRQQEAKDRQIREQIPVNIRKP